MALAVLWNKVATPTDESKKKGVFKKEIKMFQECNITQPC